MLEPMWAYGEVNGNSSNWLDKHERYDAAISEAEQRKIGYPEFKRWLEWCDTEYMQDMRNILRWMVELMADNNYRKSVDDPSQRLGKEDIVDEIERRLTPRKKKKKKQSAKCAEPKETDTLKQIREKEGGSHKVQDEA